MPLRFRTKLDGLVAEGSLEDLQKYFKVMIQRASRQKELATGKSSVAVGVAVGEIVAYKKTLELFENLELFNEAGEKIDG